MKDLTQGSINRHLLRMSAALLLNMLTGSLFSLVNIFWLGRLGASAQAAVTLAAIPVMLALTLLPVVSMGAGILISHAVGAKDRERANRIFNEAFGASLLVTALIGAVAWANRAAFGFLMTSDPATAALIASYFRWFIPSVVVQVPLFVLAGALESTGNLRTGTIAQSATVVLNAVLAPLLMFGWLGMPQLGVDGAGLASFVSNAATMIAVLLYFARGNTYLTMRPRIWLARPRELPGALKIGLPTGIESGVVAAYLFVIALMLRPFGPDQQAAFGIGQRLFQAALMPLVALSGAASLIAGQSHGAGLGRRVRETLRAGMLFGLIVAPVLVVAFEAFAPWLCGNFSTDPAVVAAGSVFLRIGALSLIPASTAYAIFAVLSGVGDTRASLYAQLGYAILAVALVCVLSQVPGFRPSWMWTAMLVAGFVEALMAWYFLRKAFGNDGGRLAALPATGMGAAP